MKRTFYFEHYSIIACGLTDLNTWTFESLKKIFVALKDLYFMGIEYCHKSRAHWNTGTHKSNIRTHKSNICFFFPPSAFPCTCKLYFILHLCPLVQCCGLRGEKQLGRAQSPLAILSPACARRLLASKSLLSSVGNLSPCSCLSEFF